MDKKARKRSPNEIIENLLSLKGAENKSLADFFESIKKHEVKFTDISISTFREIKKDSATRVAGFLENCEKEAEKIIAEPESYREDILITLKTLALAKRRIYRNENGFRIAQELASQIADLGISGSEELPPGSIALLELNEDFGKDDKMFRAVPIKLPEGTPEESESYDAITPQGGAKSNNIKADSKIVHATEQNGFMLKDAYRLVYELCESLKIRIPSAIARPDSEEISL